MPLSPPTSHGGSLPAWWTVVNTPGQESLSLNSGAVAADYQPILSGYRTEDGDLKLAFKFGSDGGLSILAADPETDTIHMGWAPGVVPLTDGNLMRGNGYGGDGFGGHFILDRHACVQIHNVAEPPDGDIQGNGYVMFWFDQTNGAAKLMLKGKTSDGTLVAGEVALT